LKLPNADRAQIAPEKVVGYLLSPGHPSGASKARFFHRIGFTPEKAPILVGALLRLARDGEVKETVGTPFGTKYVVSGDLYTPSGRLEPLRTVWIVLEGGDIPFLVTAYPGQD
jgi:hypothetical protein